MPEPIAELLMPKAPQIHMSGDVILLDIDNVVPGWETYMFSLDANHSGKKKIVLRIKHRAVDTNSVQVQVENAITSNNMLAATLGTEDLNDKALTVPIKDKPGIVLKLELPDPVKLEDEEIFIDNTGDYIRCPVIPCHLLVRPEISSRGAPSRYLIRTFDTFFLPSKIYEKRFSPEEYRERLSKRLQLT